ncbi:hypothetical protein COT40_00120 [Candidatus Peregrinibacteria bacterium CG08_land_8_20_14_0_20_41_10]|nr:MAG: hypothetical protein COT40_00120 [Candidatus Peregrinibacteria bacterium CG08_land_8_20_14_0_20_41_10]
MEKYVKFLRKLNPDLRVALLAVIAKIAANELKTLDLKRLAGTKDLYRCRVGKIRIIFQKTQPENIILDIGFRGNIY